MSNKTYYTFVESPLGQILLVGDGVNLTELNFQAGKRPTEIGADWQQDDAPFAEAMAQLQAYFTGELQAFDLPLQPDGTLFQRHVWQQLQAIPYGETISYGQLAQRLGKPTAARAVGLANGANPISLVIPCHRVIGSTGHLTGYGAGLPIKEALLAHEQNPQGQFVKFVGTEQVPAIRPTRSWPDQFATAETGRRRRRRSPTQWGQD